MLTLSRLLNLLSNLARHLVAALFSNFKILSTIGQVNPAVTATRFVALAAAMTTLMNPLATFAEQDQSGANYQLEVITHLNSSAKKNELVFWVSAHQSYVQQSFALTIDRTPNLTGNTADLSGTTLIATPGGNSKPQGIEKLTVQCLNHDCENFEVSLLGQSTTPKAKFRRVIETRFVEVHTSLDLSRQWLSQVEYATLSSADGNLSSYRIQQFDSSQKLVFDLQGPLLQKEGLCVGSTMLQPWPGKVKSCLAGLGADGSLLIRVQPVVVIANQFAPLNHRSFNLAPFDLPINEINQATRSARPVSIWIKILPTNFSLPTEKSKVRAHGISGTADEIFAEIDEAGDAALVQDRIKKIWLKSQAPRLIGFLRLIKSLPVSARRNACDARTMIETLAEQGLPQVTAMISLVESGFNAHALSDKGAVGFWQFTSQTAADYGLKLAPIDERTLIKPSTNAASRYLINSLHHYPGPNSYKLALASYNSGVRAVDTQVQNLPTKKKNEDVVLNFQDMMNASKNFWDLYKYGLLYLETQRYVLDIMATSYLALHPEEFNLDASLAFDGPSPLPSLNCPKIAK